MYHFVAMTCFITKVLTDEFTLKEEKRSMLLTIISVCVIHVCWIQDLTMALHFRLRLPR